MCPAFLTTPPDPFDGSPEATLASAARDGYETLAARDAEAAAAQAALENNVAALVDALAPLNASLASLGLARFAVAWEVGAVDRGNILVVVRLVERRDEATTLYCDQVRVWVHASGFGAAVRNGSEQYGRATDVLIDQLAARFGRVVGEIVYRQRQQQLAAAEA